MTKLYGFIYINNTEKEQEPEFHNLFSILLLTIDIVQRDLRLKLTGVIYKFFDSTQLKIETNSIKVWIENYEKYLYHFQVLNSKINNRGFSDFGDVHNICYGIDVDIFINYFVKYISPDEKMLLASNMISVIKNATSVRINLNEELVKIVFDDVSIKISFDDIKQILNTANNYPNIILILNNINNYVNIIIESQYRNFNILERHQIAYSFQYPTKYLEESRMDQFVDKYHKNYVVINGQAHYHDYNCPCIRKFSDFYKQNFYKQNFNKQNFYNYAKILHSREIESLINDFKNLRSIFIPCPFRILKNEFNKLLDKTIIHFETWNNRFLSIDIISENVVDVIIKMKETFVDFHDPTKLCNKILDNMDVRIPVFKGIQFTYPKNLPQTNKKRFKKMYSDIMHDIYYWENRHKHIESKLNIQLEVSSICDRQIDHKYFSSPGDGYTWGHWLKSKNPLESIYITRDSTLEYMFSAVTKKLEEERKKLQDFMIDIANENKEQKAREVREKENAIRMKLEKQQKMEDLDFIIIRIKNKSSPINDYETIEVDISEIEECYVCMDGVYEYRHKKCGHQICPYCIKKIDKCPMCETSWKDKTQFFKLKVAPE